MKQMVMEQKIVHEKHEKVLKSFGIVLSRGFFVGWANRFIVCPPLLWLTVGRTALPAYLKFSSQFSFNHDKNSFDFFRVPCAPEGIRVFRGQILGRNG